MIATLRRVEGALDIANGLSVGRAARLTNASPVDAFLCALQQKSIELPARLAADRLSSKRCEACCRSNRDNSVTRSQHLRDFPRENGFT